MISFVYPHFFGIFGIPLLLFSFFILRHNESFLDIFSQEVLERLSQGDDTFSIRMRNFMIIFSVFFMLIALARPVIDHGKRIVHLEGLSIVVALDISGSMRSEDVYPNRLELAKQKIVQVLDKMPNDEFSVIAFAYSSFMLAPLSSDKESLRQIVKGINDDYINMSSTDFKALGIFSKKILKKKKPKILLVLSDGGELKDLDVFAKTIKKEQITLYSIIVGTEQGSPVLDSEGKALHYKGSIVLSQRNDYLGKISIESGGAFVVASNGEDDVKRLVNKMKKNHQNKEQGSITIYDREEYFYYPLALGLLILLFSFSSFPRLKREII